MIRVTLIALLLTSCASVFDVPPPVNSTIPLGEITVPYEGWDDYCRRHAERVECS